MRRNAFFSIIGLFLILSLVIPQPASCGGQLTIDRGCGATYYLGEVVTIGYIVTASEGSSVTVTLKVLDVDRRKVFTTETLGHNQDGKLVLEGKAETKIVSVPSKK